MNSKLVLQQRLIADQSQGRDCSTSKLGHPPIIRHVDSNEHEPNSKCLAMMVQQFIENVDVVDNVNNTGRGRCNCQIGTCDDVEEPSKDDNDESKSLFGEELLEILQDLIECMSEIEQMVLKDVKKAVYEVTEQASKICEAEGPKCSKGCLKGALLKILRDTGYNAAICKSKLDHVGDISGAYHEYIDVVLQDHTNGKEQRLIVDSEFRGEFEIARPTKQYTCILQELPVIFVGKLERLERIIVVMSDAMKASLRKRHMSLPPWRTEYYMKSKWFPPYKRITNNIVALNHQQARIELLSDELARTSM